MLSKPPQNRVNAARNAVSRRVVTDTTRSKMGVEISSMPHSKIPAPIFTAVIIRVKVCKYPKTSSRGTETLPNALGLNRNQ